MGKATNSLNAVIQEIGKDIKAIQTKLNRQPTAFNPKHYKEFPSNRYIEIADGVYMRGVEMRRVKFSTVEYCDEYTPIEVAVNSEEWGDWNFGYEYPAIEPEWDFKDGTVYDLEERWLLESVEGAGYSNSEGGFFYDITGDEIFVNLRHPQVNYGERVRLRLYKA